MTTLAILWDKSKDSMHYMLLDKKTGGVPLLPASLNGISLSNVNTSVANIFDASKTHTPTELEYKVLQHGPAQNIGSHLQPHALSTAVLRAITSSASASKLRTNSQLKSKLTGNSLVKFKKGMKQLGLVSTVKGTAWQIHLWSVALHATNGTHKKVMLEYWSRLTGTAARTKVGRQQFAKWYASL